MSIIQVKIVQYYATLVILIVILVIEEVSVLIVLILQNLDLIVKTHVKDVQI